MIIYHWLQHVMLLMLLQDEASCEKLRWIGSGLSCVCIKRKGTYERICKNFRPVQLNVFIQLVVNCLGHLITTAELFSALRGRLYDSNKNLVMATLSTIGGLVSAMGPSVEKSSKGILADVLKCLGDNKKHMRECTLTALDSLVAAAQLEKMVPYIIVSLGDQKTVQKGEKISLIGCLSMFQK
ncbi:Protein MOR1 [Zea mays]|uniref:Protein MOR1 n=2 Tax=Zea mays TaxID=4577 RepID=A0A1D6N889_MAIZE|nr:Protein MOR1 [Zea mays]ONM36801.1 Protein MOR1 [Zea mays]ONM36802.1 Protein MOR1 [Zea mays]